MDSVYTSYTDLIVLETLKRKEVLLELNESRTPDSNRRKLRAWTEIRDVVLLKCKKLMTISQIKRVWRSKKAHVRDLLLKERRYRQATGGGVDVNFERTIMKASASLTEAETQLARCLGREAVMCGIGRMETYVDKGHGSERAASESSRDGWWEGGRAAIRKGAGGREGRESPVDLVERPRYAKRKRSSESVSPLSDSSWEGRKNTWREGGRAANRKGDGGREGRESPVDIVEQPPYAKRKRNRESVSPLSDLSSEGWKNPWRDGGRADLQEEEGGRVGGRSISPQLISSEELKEIRKNRIMQQLEDFDSDCSSSPQHRNCASAKQVTKLQMELLKEERAIFTKVSIAVDKLLTVLDRHLELSNALFERIRGSDTGAQLQTKPSWDPAEGDPNLALSEASKSLHC